MRKEEKRRVNTEKIERYIWEIRKELRALHKRQKLLFKNIDKSFSMLIEHLDKYGSSRFRKDDEWREYGQGQ